MTRVVVKENIPWGGVWAHTRGQTIESDLVEANGWQEYVVGENTKEARQIKAEVTGRPVEDFDEKPAATATTKAARAQAAAGDEQKG